MSFWSWIQRENQVFFTGFFQGGTGFPPWYTRFFQMKKSRKIEVKNRIFHRLLGYRDWSWQHQTCPASSTRGILLYLHISGGNAAIPGPSTASRHHDSKFRRWAHWELKEHRPTGQASTTHWAEFWCSGVGPFHVTVRPRGRTERSVNCSFCNVVRSTQLAGRFIFSVPLRQRTERKQIHKPYAWACQNNWQGKGNDSRFFITMVWCSQRKCFCLHTRW